MPTHMAGFFSAQELRSAELSHGFSFTRGLPLLKIETESYLQSYRQGDLLFDLENDPEEKNPIQDKALEKQLKNAMVKLMKTEDAPAEQYRRLGLNTDE